MNRVWSPSCADGPEGTTEVCHMDAASAAIEYVETGWADLDSPDRIEIHTEHDGVIEIFEVEAELTVTFRAWPRPSATRDTKAGGV